MDGKGKEREWKGKGRERRKGSFPYFLPLNPLHPPPLTHGISVSLGIWQAYIKSPPALAQKLPPQKKNLPRENNVKPFYQMGASPPFLLPRPIPHSPFSFPLPSPFPLPLFPFPFPFSSPLQRLASLRLPTRRSLSFCAMGSKIGKK